MLWSLSFILISMVVANQKFLTITAASNEELIFVLEVARHGARNPQTILPFNATSVQYTTTLDLQKAGWLQHYYIGSSLRDKYVTNLGFLSSDYNSSEFYSQSTSASRTYESIMGQLSGFFPDNAPSNSWLPVSQGTKTQGYNITQANSTYNWASRLNEGNCAKYNGSYYDVLTSNQYKLARGYFYTTYKSDLEKLVGWSNISESTFDDICEYIFFSSYNSSISLNFTTSAFDRAYCKAYENGWVYKTAFGIDTEWKHQTFEFLNQLLEFSQYLQGKKTLSQLTTFQKYYALNNSGKPFPKFILYITHDEILASFFEGLGWHQVKSASPAATMFFEFYKDRNQGNNIYVRAFYNDTNTTTAEVKVNGASSGTMSIADFEAAISSRITTTGISGLSTSCSDPYTSSGNYYEPETFKKEMKQIYTELSQPSLLSRTINMMALGAVALAF